MIRILALGRYLEAWLLVNGTGNPQVSPAEPVPVPVDTGTGFMGTGDRFQQPRGKVN